MPSAHSFAVLQSESAWGTVGADVDRYIPFSSFGLKAEVETRNAKTNCGILQPRFAEKVRRTIKGPITCPLSGYHAPSAAESFAQYLIAWAFSSPETAQRASKSLHWIDDVSASRFTGLRVDEATLTGDENGLMLSLGLVGKTELASVLATTLPDDRGKMLDFQFSDVSLVFDGAALPIESFEWSIRHGLKLKHNGYTPSSLRSTGGSQTLTIKPLKTSAAWAVLQRVQAMPIKTATLMMTGLHGGTAADTSTRCVLAFNRLALIANEDSPTLDDYNWQPLTFACLKPNSATASVGQTWDTV